MSDYHLPTIVSTSPQGQFSFTPRVKTFTGLDPLLIEADINQWFLDRIPIPNIRVVLQTVQWATSEAPGMAVNYSALVLYYEVEGI